MSICTPIYHQLLNLLRQHTTYKDLRHLQALALMIHALISSGTINLNEWEAYVCSGRAIPFLWKAMEHNSSTVAFREYKLILRLAPKILSEYDDVMVLADRGFANYQILRWLQTTNWDYCLRLPIDVHMGNGKCKGKQLKTLLPPVGEATFYHNVFLWLENQCQCNLVLANVRGINDPWAIITSEKPTLETLWQYGLRFSMEELFLDSKSGAFQLEQSKIRNSKSLDRLYLVVALAILFSTSQGMAVQIKGLRTQVDPHYSRGISYFKIGLRWLTGVIHKGRNLFPPMPLLSKDPEPCFASKKAKEDYYDAIWFSRIKEIKYYI
ncbi:MAG: transposase [Cyanobacterium sp. T60_A2020_053]|nr:transposase [Cyanobacterium sp. T60_A2020_053]